jgi:hypothetical protein
MDPSDSRYGPVGSSCEHGNGTLDSINCWKIVERLSDYQLIKKVSDPCSSSVHTWMVKLSRFRTVCLNYDINTAKPSSRGFAKSWGSQLFPRIIISPPPPHAPRSTFLIQNYLLAYLDSTTTAAESPAACLEKRNEKLISENKVIKDQWTMSLQFHGAQASAAKDPVLTSVVRNIHLREDHISVSYIIMRRTVTTDTLTSFSQVSNSILDTDTKMSNWDMFVLSLSKWTQGYCPRSRSPPPHPLKLSTPQLFCYWTPYSPSFWKRRRNVTAINTCIKHLKPFLIIHFCFHASAVYIRLSCVSTSCVLTRAVESVHFWLRFRILNF